MNGPRDTVDDDADEGTPLESLSEAIRNRRGEGHRLLEGGGPNRSDTPTTVWERLLERDRVEVVPSTTGRDGRRLTESGSVDLSTYPWATVFVAHVVITVLAFISAILVYGASALGVIPREFWLLSLPLLAMGLFGAVPILAWWLEIWVPQALR